MPVDSIPHASWAEIYDVAYEHSFGEFYTRLTDVTVEAIQDRIDPPAKLVDFGAGTGRLAIPLSSRGYEVVAVEPCREMLCQLKKKDGNGTISTVCSRMEDFQGTEEFDFAMCVFTVLLYLLDEVSLKSAIHSAYTCLKPGGSLLIDIPSRGIFHGHSSGDDVIERNVSVTPEEGDLFRYQESIRSRNHNGVTGIYEDEFLIRYWPEEKVLSFLRDAGFVPGEDLSSFFFGAGSSYYVMNKTPHAP